MFAWEAHEKGVDVHALAEPTKLELLKKAFETKKDEFKGSLTRNVIDKYGGEEHLEAPPKTLLLAQTEDYTEYSRQGKIIKVRILQSPTMFCRSRMVRIFHVYCK